MEPGLSLVTEVGPDQSISPSLAPGGHGHETLSQESKTKSQRQTPVDHLPPRGQTEDDMNILIAPPSSLFPLLGLKY